MMDRQNNGWVKQYRFIRTTWIWTRSEWVKWWDDLVMSASLEEGVIIKGARSFRVHPNEIITSYRSLQRRWGVKSYSTVKRFLDRLILTGLISRSSREPFKDGDKKSERFCEQSVKQSVKHNSEQKSEQSLMVIIMRNFDMLSESEKNEVSGFASSNVSSSVSDNASDNAHTYIRNKEKINNKLSSSTPPCAREEKFLDEDFWRKVFDEKENVVTKIAAALEIEGGAARRLCEQVRKEWALREKQWHRDWDDAITHLMDHIRKNLPRSTETAPPAESKDPFAARNAARQRLRDYLDQQEAEMKESLRRAGLLDEEEPEEEERYGYDEYEEMEE